MDSETATYGNHVMGKGKLYLVGMGPGGFEDMTHRAAAAVRECGVLCGYSVYLDLV